MEALLDMKLEKDTIWLRQKQMAFLFGKDTNTIGLHIRNAVKEGQLDKRATTEEYCGSLTGKRAFVVSGFSRGA